MSLKSNILFVSLVVLVSCTDDNVETAAVINNVRIELNGNKIDTAYLFAVYRDPGASFFEDRDGLKNCNEYGIVSDVTGSVNTDLPGIYYLTYNAKDTSGNPLPSVTRTVVVVNNSTSSLNGLYNVSCTCTAVAKSADPTVTVQNYTAIVNPSSHKDHFELISLELGGEKLVNTPCVIGNKLELSGFFTASFDWSSSGGTGTLSPSKNGFTIETQAQRFTPSARYYCKNVFTKLVTIRSSNSDNKN